MKILFCKWGSMCETGMMLALKKLGHTYIELSKQSEDMDYDKEYLQEISACIQSNADISCVMSANYIPIVARACKVFQLPYLSWTADSPCTYLNSKTLSYNSNRVFLFDRMQFMKYSPQNKKNIFYLPLAGDPETIDMQTKNISKDEHKKYDCDISFIGSLYTEMCKYNEIENKLSNYTKGYVEGLLSAQQNVYGYNFLEESMSKEWINRFTNEISLPQPTEDYNDDLYGTLADLYLGYKCTEQERIHILDALSQNHNVDLYTLSDTSSVPKVHVKGIADSKTMMPKIFHCSKINLNMTNRAIKTGLPLRIFDIMSAGGFLMTNYQPEISEYFTIDKDLVAFESIPDLLEKVDFYLAHDDVRKQIARNGYDAIRRSHTYVHRLQMMFEMIDM